jgi:hypothetical protein
VNAIFSRSTVSFRSSILRNVTVNPFAAGQTSTSSHVASLAEKASNRTAAPPAAASRTFSSSPGMAAAAARKCRPAGSAPSAASIARAALFIKVGLPWPSRMSKPSARPSRILVSRVSVACRCVFSINTTICKNILLPFSAPSADNPATDLPHTGLYRFLSRQTNICTQRTLRVIKNMLQ